MKNITLAVAALLILSSRGFAAVQVMPLTDMAFAHSVAEIIEPFQAKDAFASAGVCGIVDAKFFRPFSVEESIEALKPCFEALSAVYGTELSLKPEAKGLVLETGLTTLGSPLLRDLEQGLSRRDHRLLGHPVIVRRAMVPSRMSRVQEVIEACMKPMVIRKIETGADFLKVYGGCLAQDKAIKEVRASASQKLGLTVLAAGDQPQVESLTGMVSVLALNGRVELQVIAYSEQLNLP